MCYDIHCQVSRHNISYSVSCHDEFSQICLRPSWSWSYGSWIYNYLCNRCLSPLIVSSNPVHGDVYPMQHYVIKFVSEFAIGRWFSPGTPASSTNKTDRHDRTEIVFKKEFKDTIGVIRIRISKNRQHNGQMKKYKRKNNDLQNIHIKLKIEKHEPHSNSGVNSINQSNQICWHCIMYSKSLLTIFR